MTRKTYCGNLLWQSSLTLLAPFDVLDEIDGKDVEKIALGAALGIGGVLAIKGLCSFFDRD